MNTSESMPHVIGLTGGIGSGKSTVAALFRRHHIPVIDLDALGRQINRRSSVSHKLCRIAGIVDGPRMRADLRNAIFASPHTRQRVERFLHPLIWREFQKEARKTKRPLVLCEAALLIEAKLTSCLDGLIVVMAPKSVRKSRVIRRDKIPPRLFEKINGTQTTDSIRRKKATYLVRNTGSAANLRKQVLDILKKLRTTSSAAK